MRTISEASLRTHYLALLCRLVLLNDQHRAELNKTGERMMDHCIVSAIVAARRAGVPKEQIHAALKECSCGQCLVS